MNKISLRTKIKAVVVAMFLILLSIGVVLASVTRTISDTGDDFDTFIRNSNGNYWEATGANIQAAIDDLTSGGTVRLPSGTIYISTRIVLENNIALIGAGKGITFITAASGMNLDMVVCWDTVETTPRNNITIKDFTVEGNTTCNNGVLFYKVTDFLIENIAVRNAGGSCFMVGATSNECKRGIVINCDAYNAGTYHGFGFHVNESRISKLYSYGSTEYGFDFHTCHNNTISDIISESNTFGGKFFGDPGEWGGNNVVSGINIKKSTSGAVPAMRIIREHNSTFTGIDILDVGYCGLEIDGSTYLSFTNVHIDTTGNVALKIDNTIGSVSHLSITGGYVKNPTLGALRLDTADNVTISNFDFEGATHTNSIISCKNFKFIGCRFIKGTSKDGLLIQSSHYFQIDNCDFLYNALDGIDTKESPNSNYSITDSYFIGNFMGMDIGADSNITITGCLFQDNSNDGIQCAALDSVQIQDCTMWGDPFDDNIVGEYKRVAEADNMGMSTI